MEPRHRLEDLRRRLADLRRSGEEFVGDTHDDPDDDRRPSTDAD